MTGGGIRRGVFDVDEDRALEALRLVWGEDYDIGFEGGRWVATSRDGERRTFYGAGRAEPGDPGRLEEGGSTVRFRENTEEYRARARDAVAAWRAAHPAGTAEQMLSAVGPAFHRDYAPVLRSFLLVIDKHAGRVVTGQAGAGG